MKIIERYLAILVLIIGVVTSSISEAGNEDVPSAAGEMLEETNKDLIGDSSAKSSSEEEGKPLKTDKKMCPMVKVVEAMSKVISALVTEIQGLKEEVRSTCSGAANVTSADNDTLIEDFEKEISKVLEEVDGEKSDGDMSQPSVEELPPIPQECFPPFSLLANTCLYVVLDNSEWNSWGGAQAYCQLINSTLVSPYRVTDLQSYLSDTFSNVFWVGARYYDDTKSWKWLNGNEVLDNIWQTGQPSSPLSKQCLFLGAWSEYRAANHYCGEKFPYICEQI